MQRIDIYRALLHLYPAPFRHEYGPQMTLAFHDELEEARQAGEWWRVTSLWLNNISDVFITAPREHLHVIQQDLRYAIRQFAASPGFTVVAILSLALGIGANIALFSLINSVLLSSLPVSEPSSLVLLTDPGSAGVAIGSQNGDRSMLSYPEFRLIQSSAQSFNGVLASQSSLSTVNAAFDGSGPEELKVRTVSNSYFDVLGVHALRGRTWSGQESPNPDTEPGAVISYEFWQRRFSGRDAALGKQIRIRRGTFTVIGVMPASFFGESVGQRPDAWLPLNTQPLILPGPAWLQEAPGVVEKTMWLHAIARLKPNVSVEQAEANVNLLFQQSMAEYYGSRLDPEKAKQYSAQRIKVHPAATGASSVRKRFAEPLLLLLAAAGIVLFIACANLGNILLSRVMSRNRELSIRLALGASRRRLVRQLITESFVLAVAGGIAGIAAAALLRAGLMLLVPNSVELPASPDLHLLSFAFGVTLLAGLGIGLLPILRVSGLRMLSGLHENSRASAGSVVTLRMSRFVVIGQVALSLPLLVGSGMLLLTLYNLQRVDLGFKKEHLVVARLDLRGAGYEGAAIYPAIEQIRSRLLRIPGITGFTYSNNGVFSGIDNGDRIEVEGYLPANDEAYGSNYDTVGPDYFSFLGIPILRGRGITERDTPGAARVCVVNEAFAKSFFNGRNPLGMRVTQIFGNTRNSYEVVGVVRDANTRSLRGEISPRFYLPLTQPVEIPGHLRFTIRAATDPQALVEPVRRAMREVNPDFANATVSPVDVLINEQLEQARLLAQLSIVFGGIALALAMIGLYGVLSHDVARRTRELGVRKALGARQWNIVALIFRQTGVLMAVGLVLGVGIAAAALRLISSRLYGLQSTDPVMYAAAIVILVTVAIIASGLPAQRAARVDPIIALRQE